jgi:hypothetical protein
VPDTDSDNDGTPDCNDLCPADPNKTAPGVCGCGNPETPGCGQMFTLRITVPANLFTSNPAPRACLPGEMVEISPPEPPAGYRFTHWSGDATGAAVPLYIAMDDDKTIEANYEECPQQWIPPCGPWTPVCIVGTILGLGLMKTRIRRR